jgi:prevent-host-death family protein
MKTIPAGQFKARCLKIMDDVKSQREPVLITKKGKPVARLVPADDRPVSSLGFLADRVEIVGDLVAPAVETSEWAVLMELPGARNRRPAPRRGPRPRGAFRRRS